MATISYRAMNEPSLEHAANTSDDTPYTGVCYAVSLISNVICLFFDHPSKLPVSTCT